MNRSSFDPRPATISHYSGRVPVFASSWGPVLAALAAPIFAALADRAPHRILDLGCGVGTAFAHLPRADTFVGIDHFREMLTAAQLLSPGLQPVLADAARLPFGDAVFDLVFAGFMLHHVREQWRALGEVHRVLRPGGVLALATWGRKDPGGPAFDLFESTLQELGAPDDDPAPPPTWSESIGSTDALGALVASLGFTSLRVWCETPAWTWEPERLLDYLSGLGGTARRMEQLSATDRIECRARVSRGLARLGRDSLTWRPEIVFVMATRGTGTEGSDVS